MDGSVTQLTEKLDSLLREAAEVSVALDRANGTIVGVPHYSVIETRAHQLGQQLSREIQARHVGLISAGHADLAKCPGCGARCETSTKKRSTRSIDGPLTIDETAAHCPTCRRDFFPPPGSPRA